MDGECNDLEILTELIGFGNPLGGHEGGRSEERLANTRTHTRLDPRPLVRP